MKKILKIITVLIIYLLSTYYMYNWVSIAHSKEGYLNYRDVNYAEIIFTFIPLFNSVSSVLNYFFWSPYEDRRETVYYFGSINLNSLYNIKK
jgi:hypothetical protein